MKRKILFVGFSPEQYKVISDGLENDYSLENISSVETIGGFNPDAVLLYASNLERGLSALDEIKAFNKNLPVLVIWTPSIASIKTAITFVKYGAFDLSQTPISLEALKILISRMIEKT